MTRPLVRCCAIGVLAAAVLAAGCEGVTIEVLEPGLADGGVGAPSVVGWEVRFEPIEGDGCPLPVAQRFDAPSLWIPAGAGVMPIDSIDLSPGRYVVSAIGRDDACAARYYGRTCIGPEPPPRALMIATCDVGAPRCADFTWTENDRAALACAGTCSAGHCP